MTKIIVATTHIEVPRYKKIAPMGYACISLNASRIRWGIGGEKNTEVMVAHAAARVITDIFADSDEGISLEIVARKIGWKAYFEKYIPQWIAENRIGGAYAGEIWKDAFLQAVLTNAVIRKPNKIENPLVRRLHEFVDQSLQRLLRQEFAENNKRFHQLGIYLTDADVHAPKLDCEL